MKQLAVAYLLFCSVVASGQMYDAQWIVGPRISMLDFRPADSVHIYTSQKWMNTKLATANISDEDGNLLYYTNGIYIAGSNGDSILNGNGLSPCSFTDSYVSDGLPIQQAVLFLPMPGSNRYYYLLHFSGDTSGSRPGTLYYSIIDKEGNGGQGEVVQKNTVYFKEIFRGGGMTACKHANGRDWWIIVGGRNNNSYYKFLLTPEGVSDIVMQNIGPNYNGPYDIAYSCFSPDGSKYATGAYKGYITVMDFDRCTGQLSSPVIISNIPNGYSSSGSSSLAFSPNGRFLYVANRIDVVQFDLLSANIQDSVAVYLSDSNDLAQIDFLALSINGKIYGSTWAGGFYFLHVINHPDSLGVSCGFAYGDQPTLSTNSVNLPNMPNYRLGPLVGSGCGTLTDLKSAPQDTRILRIQPNPADKYVYVEMGAPGNYEFELLNEVGQLITAKQTRQVDIFDTEYLAAGVYFIKIIDVRSSQLITSRKIVVQH
jgi:hypothetical protein